MLLCFEMLLVVLQDLDNTWDDHKGCSLLIGSRSFAVFSDLRSQNMLLTAIVFDAYAGVSFFLHSGWTWQLLNIVGKFLWQPSEAVLYLGKFVWLEEGPSLHGVSWCCVRFATELTRNRSILDIQTKRRKRLDSSDSSDLCSAQGGIWLRHLERYSRCVDQLWSSNHPVVTSRAFISYSEQRGHIWLWWLWGCLKISIPQDLQNYESSM